MNPPIKPHDQLELVWQPCVPAAITREDGSSVAEWSAVGDELTIAEGCAVVADFGEELVGRPWVELAGRGGVEMSYGETMDEVNATEAGVDWYHPPRDRCEGSGGLSPTGRRAGRWLRVANVGPSSLTLASVGWELVHRPVRQTGSFACSDAVINQAWEICSRTTRLCMQRFLEDGVKRDGLLWIGDARVQMLCANAVFDDHELIAASMLMIAAGQRADGALPACAAHGGGHQHPDTIDYMPGCPFPGTADWIILNFCSDFLGMARDHHLHRGDIGLLRKLQPCLRGLACFLVHVDLADGGERDRLVDSPGQTQQGAFLGMLAEGAQAGCELAAWLDDAELGDNCRALADRALWFLGDSDPITLPARRFNGEEAGRWQAFWVGWQHAVLAGWLKGDEALARLGDLEGEHALKPVAGFSRFWQGEALGRCGRVNQLLDSAREWYGPMLEAGATTTWENLDLNPGRTPPHQVLLSRCHGWSASLNHLLPRFVLGLRPISPGWTHAEWRPSRGGLTWAEGAVATPLGPVKVLLDDQYAHIQIPPGMTVSTEGGVLGPGTARIPNRSS